MADFPPHWVPYVEEPPYYQNIALNFRPSLEQPLVGLGRGGSLPPGRFAGLHRPVIGGSYVSPLPAPYQQNIGNPVQPQLGMLMETRDMDMLRQQTRVVEHNVRTQSVTQIGHAKNDVKSFGKKYGRGTGVFLPVPHPIGAPGTSQRQQGENTEQKNEANETEVEKEGESDVQLPPDISLPSEWVY